MRELRSLLSAQQEKVAGLESEAAELKLLHTELKHEVLVLKVRTRCTHSTVVHTTCAQLDWVTQVHWQLENLI